MIDCGPMKYQIIKNYIRFCSNFITSRACWKENNIHEKTTRTKEASLRIKNKMRKDELDCYFSLILHYIIGGLSSELQGIKAARKM